MEQEETKFNYSSIPVEFYDNISRRKKGMRSYWHNHKFKRIIDSFEQNAGSILDIGCFSGTFLSMISKDKIPKQVGIDILKPQVEFANQKYGTSFRDFYLIDDLNNLSVLEDQQFDYVTIIEVIEHLKKEEINEIINLAYRKLKTNGKLIITTPNYFSLWPIQEIILNYISDISYEEQHITHFNYFNIEGSLARIIANVNPKLHFDFKTTTHFLSPFIAIISYRLAENISSFIKPSKWRLPFGSLILIQFTKK